MDHTFSAIQNTVLGKVSVKKFCEISKNTFFTEHHRANASVPLLKCVGTFSETSIFENVGDLKVH